LLHFKYNYDKCVRSKGNDCRNCVSNCLMKILSIKQNKVEITNIDECIFCLNCQGACIVDGSVIQIWDDQKPALTPVLITTKSREKK